MKEEFIGYEDYPEIGVYNAKMYRMPVIGTVVVIGMRILTLLIVGYLLRGLGKLFKFLVGM